MLKSYNVKKMLRCKWWKVKYFKVQRLKRLQSCTEFQSYIISCKITIKSCTVKKLQIHKYEKLQSLQICKGTKFKSLKVKSWKKQLKNHQVAKKERWKLTIL